MPRISFTKGASLWNLYVKPARRVKTTALRQRMLEDMIVRNFSPNTQRAYVDRVAQFARYFGRSPQLLGPKHIHAYQVFLAQTKKASWSTFNQAMCALRFLYRITLEKDWVIRHIPYPKQEKKLPVVYLGRYTHRVAISNNRLLSLEVGKVTFSWKDYRSGNAQRTMPLDACEFIRRFLLHVLPDGFVRIRHYGLLSNCHRNEKLALCRQLIAESQPVEDLPAESVPTQRLAGDLEEEI